MTTFCIAFYESYISTPCCIYTLAIYHTVTFHLYNYIPDSGYILHVRYESIKHFVIGTAAAKTAVFSYNPVSAYFLSICLCFFLSVHLSASLSVKKLAWSVYLFLIVYVSVYLSFCPCMSVCLFVLCLSICPSVRLSVYCLSVCPAYLVCLSLFCSSFLPSFLSVCPSICLSVFVCLSSLHVSVSFLCTCCCLSVCLLHADTYTVCMFVHVISPPFCIT
jgi:hypothetical protein